MKTYTVTYNTTDALKPHNKHYKYIHIYTVKPVVYDQPPMLPPFSCAEMLLYHKYNFH